MPVTKVQQTQVSGTLSTRVSDSVVNADLLKANRTIEDDLNSLRTQVKLIMGTSAWTDNLSGSQDLADIYAGLRINAASGVANLQNDVYIANGRLFVSGSSVIAGDLTVNGTTTTINTTNLEIRDAIIGLGFASGTVQQAAGDRGWIGGISGGQNVASFWDDSASEFVFVRTTHSATGSLPIPISSYANLRAAVITGSVINATSGFSGSLTRLTNGSAYILAGAGITINTNSLGQVEITGSATTPGAPANSVQYNNAGSFGGSANFTFNGSSYVSITGSFAQGNNTFASGLNSTTGGSGTFASGDYSHAEGKDSTASGDYSHAEGDTTVASGDWSHSEGDQTTASGNYSHSEGNATTASGSYSHAEGANTLALGFYSHAEGNGSQAIGNGSHAEGNAAFAFGNYSHAEGYSTEAVGDYSHTAGAATIASGTYQNVVGKYNKRNNADSLFIIGNGSGDANGQRDDIFLVNSGSVLIGSASLASDTFFYVGTKGAANTALFAGNVHVSGTLKATLGLSGSLTRLVDGTPYLIAGSGITTSTGSNGAITITNSSAAVNTVKGYLPGNSVHINTGTGVITFGPSGANFGTLTTTTDEYIDVYLNGVYLAFGYDITNVAATTVTLDSTITTTLTSDDIISITLRNFT